MKKILFSVFVLSLILMSAPASANMPMPTHTDLLDSTTTLYLIFAYPLVSALIELAVFILLLFIKFNLRLSQKIYCYFSVFLFNIISWWGGFLLFFPNLFENLDSLLGIKEDSVFVISMVLTEILILVFEGLIFTLLLKKYFSIKRIWFTTFLANLITIVLGVVIFLVLIFFKIPISSLI